MVEAIWLMLAVGLLAYSNGANDNFKGVASLFGSHTTGYRTALWWATLTTLAGSVAALFFSARLIKTFSGQGLVPDAVTRDPFFLPAVGLGAALTVLAATCSGWPISTTHALTGGLVGAGLMAGSSLQLVNLVRSFVLPLAFTPLFSLLLTLFLYPLLHRLRLLSGVERQMCLCLDEAPPQPVELQADGSICLASGGLRLSVAELAHCREAYHGRMFGFDAQKALDRLHFLSAGAVSFARGLNDTPKIAALLVSAPIAFQANLPWVLLLLGLVMAAGGVLNARKVAWTMSREITSMNHGQGFTANAVTAFLVILASRWGLSVSTTHVSCGSLFGLGAATGEANWTTIRGIVLSWLVTLPGAAGAAAALYWSLT